MAEQRVGFRGYERLDSGFRPQQAFDPSQAIVAAGQRSLAMSQSVIEQKMKQDEDVMRAVFENNRASAERFKASTAFLAESYRTASEYNLQTQQTQVENLVEFSGTLSKLVQDFVKQKNEEQYQLGLSDVLTGKIKPDPQKAEQFRQETGILKQAAEVDSQVADNIQATGNLGAAADFRNNSRAISGWRSYGQAVGLTKTSAAKAQAFFSGFMDRTDAIVPLPDGRIIAPVKAATPQEIEAALEVAQQDFIKSSGINAINPIILSEHLAPTMMAVRGQLSANRLEETGRKNRETAISDLDGQAQKEFSNPQLKAQDLSESFQRLTADYEVYGGLSKGKASDRAVEQALAAITTMPKEAAEALLLELSGVPKIANEPKSITLGSAYANQFSATLDAIENRAVASQQRQERALDRQAEQAVMTLEKARQDANLPSGQLRALRDETARTLGILADSGSRLALEKRAELLAEPENVDYTLYRQYRKGIAQGRRPSQQQLEQDFRSGRITAQMREELGQYADGESRSGFMKQFGGSIKEAVTAKLREAGAISLNPFGQPLKHTQHVNQVINDLADIAYKFYDTQQRSGAAVEDNDINQLIETQLPRVIGRYFQQSPTTKEWKVKPISKNPAVTPDKVKSMLRGYVPDAGGFNPRTIQLRRQSSGNTKLMEKAEVEENIQRFQNGQPPTERAATLATSNGGLVQLLSHQAQHFGIDPAPIKNSPQAQQLAEFQSAAPRAVQRLVSSNNYLEQMLQLRRIAEAQQRNQRIQEVNKGVTPTGEMRPGVQLNVVDYLKLGLQQGLDPEKAILMAAVGLAESSGNSGAHNNNRSTGDNSYGLWQINMIDDLGPARLKRYGLRSNEDLKDPSVNARVMADILKTSGIKAWGAYTDGRYLQYMSEARRAYAQLKKSGGL